MKCERVRLNLFISYLLSTIYLNWSILADKIAFLKNMAIVFQLN